MALLIYDLILPTKKGIKQSGMIIIDAIFFQSIQMDVYANVIDYNRIKRVVIKTFVSLDINIKDIVSIVNERKSKFMVVIPRNGIRCH